MQANEKSCKGL
jgi:hypothetical protein